MREAEAAGSQIQRPPGQLVRHCLTTEDTKKRNRAMAQQLITLAALLEDLGWVYVQTVCNSISRGIQRPLLAFVGIRHAHGTQNCM